MAEYGVIGSATYAVTLSGLPEVIDSLPDNNTEQIDAQVMRNVVYTLWENGGGGGGSFSYTQTAPLSQVSTQTVGGIASGRTFSNVSLQQLLDDMFFPPVGTIIDISANPSTLEFGYPTSGTPTTTITVTVTKKTPTIFTITATDLNGTMTPAVTAPTTYNQVAIRTYTRNVTQDTITTYSLSVLTSTGTIPDSTQVTWYFPRFYGSIDINTLIGSDFNTNNLTSAQKTTIINKLKTNVVNGSSDWSPVWNGTIPIASFTKATGQLGTITITPVAGAGAHLLLIWPSDDYGDGVPTSFQFGQLTGFPFIDLGSHSVENEYGATRTCRIWIKDFRTSGATTFTIT